MRVHLICKGKPIPEIVQLGAALQDQGCLVQILNPSFALSDLFDDAFWEPYIGCDVLYYRTGFGDAARTVLAGKLAHLSVRAVNRAVIQNQLLANKVYQAIHARAVDVAVPGTLVGRHTFADVVAALGPRFVLKAANGIQGDKVFLVDSEAEYRARLEHLFGDVLCQEFVPNTGDYRVFVVGGEVVGIYKRVPVDGDFRANMSLGGRGEVVSDAKLRSELGAMAVAVANELQLDIAGIDIIQHTETGRLYFIEANINPGWKGLDETLGTDTSGVIADWMVAVGQGSRHLF